MGYYNRLSVELLGDRNRVEILRFLYRNRPNRFSQKEMSAALNITTATISRACNKLTNLNVVNHFNVGRTILYDFDDTSYISKRILVPLFHNEEHFFQDLIEDIVKPLDPKLRDCLEAIVLFGSIPRGEDGPESDIDLAIIIKRSDNISTRKKLFTLKEVRDIEEHFAHEAVNHKIHLDIHFFAEGDTQKNKRGISLAKVYENGTTIWSCSK